MVTLLPFLAIGAGLVALIVWVVRRNRAGRAERDRQLGLMGFVACPFEVATLNERIAVLENNSAYRYVVKDPQRARLGGAAAYYFTQSRKRQGSEWVSHTFLIPLARPSENGLVLFFKPSDLAAGTTATRIGQMATAAWDTRPAGLTRLEIPIDLQQGNLIGILGPANASLFELIDSKALSRLQLVADFGFSKLTCRGGWSTLSSDSTRIDLNLGRIWPLIQQLSPGISRA